MTRTFALVAITLIATLVGCAKFPYGMSLDRHNFISTPHQPLTVSIKDTITGEELLRVDVPIYKQLLIDFEHKHDWTPAQGPALPAEVVHWEVIDADRLMAGGPSGILKNRLDLPGNPVKIVVDVREAESLAAAPTYQPAGTDTSGSSGPAAPTYQPVEPQPEPAPQPDATNGNVKRGPAVRTYPEPEPAPAADDQDDQPEAPAPNYTPTEDQPQPAPAPDGDDLEDALE